ncbi:MAG: hypothetical protein IT198_10590 [Acidimicrobiia bacterium]|nr:hypothetical protein [Acidimicrobiia bacterium]
MSGACVSRIGVVGGILAVALMSLWNSAPADADLPIGCEASAGFGAGYNVLGISGTVTTDMGGHVATDSFNTNTPEIDWNEDGISDAALKIYPETGWSYSYMDGDGIHYRSLAIDYMRGYSTIDEMLLETLGIDYATHSSITSHTWPPFPTLSDNFGQMTLWIRTFDRDTEGSVDMPAGSISLNVTVPRTDGTDDEFEVTISTEGATGTETPWQYETDTVAFADFQFHELLAVGTQARDASGTVVPTSNLGVGVKVRMMGDSPLDLRASIGFEGALTTTDGTVVSTGHPGSAAVAATVTCEPAPANDIVSSYDPDVTPGVAPGSLSFLLALADVDETGAAEPAKLFTDLTFTPPPTHLKMRLSATDADVDGDGVNDSLDLDGDGTVDGLPWNRVEMSRDAATSSALTGVLGSRSASPALNDMYMAIDSAALPPDVTFDYLGKVVAVDTDGDGVSDKTSTPMDIMRLRMCPVDWSGGWEAAACATPAQPSGDVRLTLSNSVPAEVDGRIPSQFHELGDVPADIAATTDDHFSPETDRYMLMQTDATVGAWTVSGFASTLSEISLDTREDNVLSARTDGEGTFGIESRQTSTNGSTDLWAVLEELPDTLDLDLDFKDTDVDGDPTHLRWTSASETFAAVVLDMQASGGSERRTRVAGWLGRDSWRDGYAGLPATGSLSATFGTPDYDVELTTSDATFADVGLMSSTAADRELGLRTLLHASGAVPDAVRARWSLAPDGALEWVDVDTCADPEGDGAEECGGPVAAVDIAAEYAVGGPDDGGLLLPLETDFTPAPSDITATASGHFMPDPPHFLRFATDRSDPAVATWNLGGKLTGLEAARIDRSDFEATGVTDVAVETTSSMGQFGAQLEGVAEDDYKTHIWTVLAEVPDSVGLSVDSTLSDGDGISADWDVSERTGAAFAADLRESDTSTSRTRAHVAGWIGSLDGSADGIPDSASFDLDPLGDDTDLHWRSGSDMRVTAGVTLTNDADRAAGRRTRIVAGASVPHDLDVFIRSHSGTVERVELDTCGLVVEQVLGPGGGLPFPHWFLTVVEDCTAVTNVEARAVSDAGSPDDSALTGVAMPGIPEGTPFQTETGEDFTAAAQYAHAVFRRAPAEDNTGQPESGPSTAGPWGVDVKLAQLEAAAFDRSTVFLFEKTDICLSATSGSTKFGLGVYADNGDGTPATWVDSTLRGAASSALPLDLQAELGIPGDPGRVGALNSLQEILATAYPSLFPLVEVVREGCPDLGDDHVADPAPGRDENTAEQTGAPQTVLAGTARFGTRDAVKQVLSLTAPFALGTFTGIDAGFYDGDDLGVNASIDIWLPDWLEIRQPRLHTCGSGGNQDPATCHAEPTYDSTDTTDVGLGMRSLGGDLGFLNAWYLTDEPDTFADGLTRRAWVQVDDIPSGVDLAAHLASRSRDGATDVDLEVTDTSGADLSDIDFRYWDDYTPAYDGDAAEARNRIPNYAVSLTGLDSRLHVTGGLLAPTTGWAPPAYQPGEAACTGWSDDPNIIYDSLGENDPSTWTPAGPRSKAELRPTYIDASLELGGADEVEIGVDSRTDGTNQSTDFDQPYTKSQRIWFRADAQTTGRVHAMLPGIQVVQDELQPVLFGLLGTAGVQACVDIDVPLDLQWSDASELALGIDSLMATVTLNKADDADVAVDVSEYGRDGVWAAEILARFNATYYDVFTRALDQRVTAGLIDPDQPDHNAGAIPQTHAAVDDWMSDPADLDDASGWYSHDDDADREWIHVIIDPLLVEEAENLWSTDGLPFAGTFWNELWTAMNDKLRVLPDAAGTWTLPTLTNMAVPTSNTFGFSTDALCSAGDADRMVSSTLARLSDGSYLKMSVRHDLSGSPFGGSFSTRLEVYLVGYFPDGSVRFVRQLTDKVDSGFDTNPFDALSCAQWNVSGSISKDSAGALKVSTYLKSLHDGADWTSKGSQVMRLDASGNGGTIGATKHVYVDDETQSVSASGGLPAPGGGMCIWYPGDGTAVEQAPGDPASLTHTYAAPGRYHVFQVCYMDGAVFHDEEPYQVLSVVDYGVADVG